MRNQYPNLDLIHIKSVENHEEFKWKILDLIEIYKIEQDIQPNKAGYYYDFGQKWNRPYKEVFYEATWKIIDDYAKSLGCVTDQHDALWFQQYVQGTTFGWHNHNKSVALIYYVELPDEEDKTDFYNFDSIPVKEGDVIIFPSYLVHRSKPLQTNKRKTIISCNYHLKVDRDLIYADRGKPEWIKD